MMIMVQAVIIRGGKTWTEMSKKKKKLEGKEEGGGSGAGGEGMPKRTGCVAQSICFRQQLWRSAKQADTFQVSSTLKKKVPPYYRRDVEIM